MRMRISVARVALAAEAVSGFGGFTLDAHVKLSGLPRVFDERHLRHDDIRAIHWLVEL